MFAISSCRDCIGRLEAADIFLEITSPVVADIGSCVGLLHHLIRAIFLQRVECVHVINLLTSFSSFLTAVGAPLPIPPHWQHMDRCDAISVNTPTEKFCAYRGDIVFLCFYLFVLILCVSVTHSTLLRSFLRTVLTSPIWT